MKKRPGFKPAQKSIAAAGRKASTKAVKANPRPKRIRGVLSGGY